MMIRARVEIKSRRDLRSQLAGATARALNRTASSVRVVGARAIAADMGLRVGDVREEITIRRATGSHLAASLDVRGARLPLILFGARGPEPSRGRGKGVTYRLGAGGKRDRLLYAFIATMRSGHRGVFRRVGKRRKPIIELFGPSITRVFRRQTIQEAMRARYAGMMPKELAHEMEFVLKRQLS